MRPKQPEIVGEIPLIPWRGDRGVSEV